MSKRYTIHEAKTHLSKLLKEALQGEEVIIVNRDEPVVKLTPITPKKRIFGSSNGKIRFAKGWEAPLEDFDEYK